MVTAIFILLIHKLLIEMDFQQVVLVVIYIIMMINNGVTS